MPLECVAIKCAAQNHIVSGNFDRCIAVPAVSEVCRPQSKHSNRRGRLFKATARPLPHGGQTNPPGQRRAERNAAQRASSGNSFWSSASVRPRPAVPRCGPACEKQYGKEGEKPNLLCVFAVAAI